MSAAISGVFTLVTRYVAKPTSRRPIVHAFGLFDSRAAALKAKRQMLKDPSNAKAYASGKLTMSVVKVFAKTHDLPSVTK